MKKVLLLAMVLFAGCISTNFGNQNLSIDLAQKSIILGKTNKQEIIDTLGPPVTVSVYASGQAAPRPGVKELLSYYRTTQDGITGMSMTILAIYLDEKGTAIDYVITQRQ